MAVLGVSAVPWLHAVVLQVAEQDVKLADRFGDAFHFLHLKQTEANTGWVTGHPNMQQSTKSVSVRCYK